LRVRVVFIGSDRWVNLHPTQVKHRKITGYFSNFDVGRVRFGRERERVARDQKGSAGGKGHGKLMK
jgi:hypothetical protein